MWPEPSPVNAVNLVKKICYHSKDIEFFLGDYFFYGAPCRSCHGRHFGSSWLNWSITARLQNAPECTEWYIKIRKNSAITRYIQTVCSCQILFSTQVCCRVRPPSPPTPPRESNDPKRPGQGGHVPNRAHPWLRDWSLFANFYTRIRHFPALLFSVSVLFWSAIFRSCKFSFQQEVKLFGPAFSSPVIWSVIFQVLNFPGLAFSVAPFVQIRPSLRQTELRRRIRVQEPTPVVYRLLHYWRGLDSGCWQFDADISYHTPFLQ